MGNPVASENSFAEVGKSAVIYCWLAIIRFSPLSTY